MKKYVLLPFIAGLMCSCSLVKSYSSKTVEIDPRVEADLTKVELNVSPQRSSGVCYRQKGLSFKEMQANAIADALSRSQGDVLVEPRFMIEKKRSGKIKVVNVTGYPATFKNFHITSETTVSK